MRYHQLTSEERYALSALRRQGLSQAEIGRTLGRHPSTNGRELKRNSRKDGGYRHGRTTKAVNRRAAALIRGAKRRTLTITVDNGTEFHGYKQLENATDAKVYFAAPHHSWERGTSENTNGLIRQYLPKRTSIAYITQRDCTRIAAALNNRPRKRLGYLTPAEAYEKELSTVANVALQS